MGILKKIFGKKDTTTNTQVKVDPNLNSQITPYLKPEAIATPIEGTKPYVPPSPTPTPQPRGGGGSSTYIPPTTFTGKVDVKGSGGQLEETRFESGGKEVGKISYGETRTGRNTGKERFISGEPTVTTSKGVKSASFTFDTDEGKKRQVVELGGDTGGARISEYEMIIGGGGDIRPPTQGELLLTGGGIFLLPGEASSLGISTSFVEGGIKSPGQRLIESTESFFPNMKPGSSGIVFLGQKDIVGTGFETKSAIKTLGGETPLKDIGTGLSRTATHFGTFFPDLLIAGGFQTIKEGEEFKPFKSPFGETERIIGELSPGFKYKMERPISVVGKATEIGSGIGLMAVGGYQGYKGAKLLKSEGWTTGEIIGEMGGSFTPFKTTSGIYSAKLTEETPVKIISFLKEGEGFQVRNIVGKGQGFEVYSKQVSKVLPSGEVSVGATDNIILQEAIQIRGGKITSGLIYSKSEGVQFNPLREGGISELGMNLEGTEFKFGKNFFEDYKAGISTSATKQRYSLFFKNVKGGVEGTGEGFNTNLFKVSRGVGVSKDMNEVISKLSFGKRTSIPQQRIEGEVVIREPSGKYRFKPTAQGYEINLNKLLELQQPSEFGVTKIGGKKTPFADTFGDVKQLQTQVKTQQPISKSLNSQMESIQSSLSSIQKPGVIGKVYTPLTSAYYGTGQYERTEGIQVFKKPSITGGVINEYGKKEPSSFNINFGRGLPSSMEISKTFISQFQPSITITKPRQVSFQTEIPIQVYKQNEIQMLGTRQIQRQLQVPRQITTPFKTFEWGFGSGWGVPPILIPPLYLPQGKRKEKTFERGFKFTPSFGTVLGKEFGIKFETIKFGGMTGILERPFKKGIKLPTVI